MAAAVYSSRRIASSCQHRVDFMAVAARQTPDFRTISDFRKRHLAALGTYSCRCYGFAAEPDW